MPVFEYKGMSKTGKNVKGIIDADNIRTAKLKLKRDGVYVTEIKNKANSNRKKKAGPRNTKTISVEDLAMMTRQLATLLKANIPLVDSIGAVSDQVENHTLKMALSEIRNMVNEGAPLYKSLAKYPKLFNTTYISMAEAGEMSGTLDVVLLRLAEFTEAQSELNSKVKSAMIYPVLMVAFTGGMLLFLSIVLIPKLRDVFESSDTLQLEWYTEAVFSMSDIILHQWHILLIGTVATFFIFKSWKNSPNGKKQWDRISLKLPIAGPIARLIAVSRFTRTLSTLLTGGVPMLDAMGIVRNVVNNETLGVAIDKARDNISEGESIAGPLKRSEQFPPLVIHMINIGEKTGDLENMLTQVSDSYDFQVKTKIDGLTAALEPLMIIVMGVIIGGIVVSIMLPLMDMQNSGGL